MGRERGSIRWHRGGWELSWHEGIRRRFRRFRAPNNRSGRRQAEAELERLANTTGEPTVAEIVEEYRRSKWSAWSPSTRATWGHNTKHLLEAFGSTPACDLTVAQVERTYAEWMTGEDAVSAATVRRRNVALSAAMIRAERLGIVNVAVTRRVQRPSEPDTAPTDLPDVAAVLVAISKLPAGSWIAAAARLTIATGMRRGELCGLRWSDVDLDGGTVAIRGALAVDQDGSLHRKGTKTRRASAVETLDPGTVEVLKQWRRQGVENAETLGVTWSESWPVFGALSDPSRWLNPQRVTKTWIRLRGDAGLAGVRWHDLRHINATELVAAGVDPKTAAERLGHDPAMLLGRYAHARPAKDQVAADVIAAADAEAVERIAKAAEDDDGGARKAS